MIIQPIIMPIAQIAPPRSPEQTKQQRNTARMALLECAKRCDAPLDGWEKESSGAPRANQGFHWSISHKRLYAAAVIAKSPVGIDLEAVEPRKNKLHDALADESEWELLGDRSWESFFRLWTAKEATLKRHGVGVGEFSKCRLIDIVDPNHMSLDYQNQTHNIEQYIHDNHIFAVTSGPESIDWVVIETHRLLK